MQWGVGLTEYWSIGSRTHYSTIPVLRYSSPHEAIERKNI